ncbi:hypothetical protein [Paralcaligenes ureilyticus]|uniref:histidine kinase n=1 Tax=Paralcaligenes ureilyticus TaxID=627131 RepID=A0A4R3M9E8_9BURK|nr:hypothetical protein [Paralcaligenes ureilyticus]TCT10184.1 hypothetical protein EDC26_102140 [Paralcaligenes ureilyticus]
MEETEKTAELIAHELNNIFMTIGISLEMLSERVAHDETTSHLFAAARHGIEHGAKLNQQLLAFSRRQSDQSTATQVATRTAKIEEHDATRGAKPQ